MAMFTLIYQHREGLFGAVDQVDSGACFIEEGNTDKKRAQSGKWAGILHKDKKASAQRSSIDITLPS